ncbi:threonine ammonia-lyase [candidate division KSB1 bacterium]|nr:threonine ammonia-lyase [candidate division KSB1 bacterium]
MKYLTKSDFDIARENAHRYIHRTPVMHSTTLSEITGADVYLKAEMFQKAGSYKVRGPLNVLAHMSQEAKDRGLICSSAGNHAQGVARAAREFGVKATVVMAHGAPEAKISATRAYGAEVVLHGKIWDDAYAHSLELQKEHNLTYIHPFDDPLLVAGQGGVGYETIEDVPDLDMLIVPIGGGGLISGCAQIVKLINPKVKVIGVEMAHAPAMKRSIEAGRIITLDEIPIIIDGLTVKTVGKYNFEICKVFVDEIVAVDERKIFDAIPWIMERCKLVAEGAAASTVAALLTEDIKPPAGSKVACVLSGGNLNLSALQNMTWN